MQPFRKTCYNRLSRFSSPQCTFFAALLGTNLSTIAGPGHGHAASFEIQSSRDSKYNMQPQNITAVSQREMQVIVDQTKLIITERAVVKASTKCKKKSGRETVAASVEKENGSQVNIRARKGKTKMTKKQKKAAKELAGSMQATHSGEVTGHAA